MAALMVILTFAACIALDDYRQRRRSHAQKSRQDVCFAFSGEAIQKL